MIAKYVLVEINNNFNLKKMRIPLTSKECHEFEYKFVRKLQDKITCILFFIFYVNISTSISITYWLFLRKIVFMISRKFKSFVLQKAQICACISCKVLLIWNYFLDIFFTMERNIYSKKRNPRNIYLLISSNTCMFKKMFERYGT